MTTETNEMFCSICGEPNEEWGGSGFYGHNAEPINDGRCCGRCNGTHVLPARIQIIQQKTAN
jgi:hypothetical protein